MYRIGEESFRTKAEINARASSLLNETPVGVPLIPDHAAFLRGLFDLHPDKDIKSAGREIAHFEVGMKRGDDWAHRVFMVVFADGTRDDFSVGKSLLRAKAIRDAA